MQEPTPTLTTEKDDQAKKASEYFSQWYSENGDELNQARQQKYQTDPEYRAHVLEQNKAARDRRRSKAREEKREEDKHRKTRVDRAWKSHTITTVGADGAPVVVEGFTIGAVAQILTCSPQAIRLWHRNGVLPEPDFRYGGRDRLYTLEQVDQYREILRADGRLSQTKIRPRPLRVSVKTVRFADGRVRKVELFRIGILAKAAQRTVVTLEQLEAKGYLPETPFRHMSLKKPKRVSNSDLGYRLYTEEMISSVSKALEVREWEIRGEEGWSSFRDEVHTAWMEQGIIGARIVLGMTVIARALQTSIPVLVALRDKGLLPSPVCRLRGQDQYFQDQIEEIRAAVAANSTVAVAEG